MSFFLLFFCFCPHLFRDGLKILLSRMRNTTCLFNEICQFFFSSFIRTFLCVTSTDKYRWEASYRRAWQMWRGASLFISMSFIYKEKMWRYGGRRWAILWGLRRLIIGDDICTCLPSRIACNWRQNVMLRTNPQYLEVHKIGHCKLIFFYFIKFKKLFWVCEFDNLYIPLRSVFFYYFFFVRIRGMLYHLAAKL